MKDRRRQMVQTSVRNLSSHIATVGYSNFCPIIEIWDYPKGICKGNLVLLRKLKDTTGAHFQHITPAYLLNEDCSNQYYFSGSAKIDGLNNGWYRVTTESLVNGYTDSIWTNDTSKDVTCKGICIKFACGGSIAGFVYPVYIVISNLSKR